MPKWLFSCKFAACFQNTFSWEHLQVDASFGRILIVLLLLQGFIEAYLKACILIKNLKDTGNFGEQTALLNRMQIYSQRISAFSYCDI